jgi:gliding motility-associated-like protein
VGQDSFSVQWPDTGLKVIRLNNETPYCTDSFELSKEIQPIPVANAGPDKELCSGNSVQLSGSFSTADSNVTCAVTWRPFTDLSNPFSLQPMASPDSTTTYRLEVVCGGCRSQVDSMTVNVNKSPSSTVDSSLQSFCAGGQAQLTGGGFGGSGDLDYRWYPSTGLSSDTLATPTATPSQSTEYKLVVTDDSTGCESDTAYTQIVVNELPKVDAGPDTAVCSGTNQGVKLDAQITSGGFGNFAVNWTPGQSLSDSTALKPFARPDTTTIYLLEATNKGTGCSNDPTILDDSATVAVEAKPVPEANAGPQDSVFICPGGSVTIGGDPTGASPPYSYSWSPDSGLSASDVKRPTASPNFTTKYYVNVTSARGCVSPADSVVVVVKDQPVDRPDQPFKTVCQGDSVRIGTDPNPRYDYEWSPTTGLSDPNASDPLASPASSTTYTLNVSAANCPSQITDTVRVRVIEPPEIVMAQDTYDVCPGELDSIQLGVDTIRSNFDPIFFRWTPNVAIDDTTALEPMVKPTQSQRYTLTASAAQCTSKKDVQLFVKPPIDAQIELTKGDTTICRGDTVSLLSRGGRGAAEFEWLDDTSANAVRSNLTPDDTTTYTVVYREAGCVDSAAITINVRTQPEPDFSYSYQNGCERGKSGSMKVVFRDESEEADFWAWDFGDGSPVSNQKHPIHSYSLPEGTDQARYNVTLTVADSSTCDSAATKQDLVLVKRRPEADFTSMPEPGERVFVSDGEVAFEDQSTGGVDQWFWTFGDGQVSTKQNPNHTYEANGTYKVTLRVSDSLGCTDEVTKFGYRIENPKMKAPTVFTPNGDGVNDRWAINYEGPKSFRVVIYDRNGRQMYSYTENDEGWNGNGPGGPAPAGEYFYVVDIGEKTYRGSFTLLR